MKIVSEFISKDGIKIVLIQKNKNQFYSTFISPNTSLKGIVDKCWEISKQTSCVRHLPPLKWLSYAGARKRYNEMLRYSHLLKCK